MKKLSCVNKKNWESPIIGSKITYHFDKRSKIQSDRSDLVDLISLNQSILGNCPRREKN
jgi:hypothetical protein